MKISNNIDSYSHDITKEEHKSWIYRNSFIVVVVVNLDNKFQVNLFSLF